MCFFFVAEECIGPKDPMFSFKKNLSYPMIPFKSSIKSPKIFSWISKSEQKVAPTSLFVPCFIPKIINLLVLNVGNGCEWDDYG